MSEIHRNTPDGRWQIYGWRQTEMEEAARLGARLAREGAVVGELREFGKQRVYLKGAPLATKPSWRHAIRQHLLRRPAPRLSEYMNLSWMTERHFQVPLPIAGGALWRGGRPRYQFLMTCAVPGAVDFADFLGEPEAARGAVLEELAREVARLHALHFVHRDLYPRNLLVAPANGGRRVYFLDAWRGGSRFQSRGPAHDLGCFFLSAAELLTSEEQARFLADYADERTAQGQPLTGDWLGDAARARAAEWTRLDRHPARRRGRELPRREWNPRALLAAHSV